MNLIPNPIDQKDIIGLLKGNELPFEDLDFNRQQFWIKKESNEIIAVCAIEEYRYYGLLRLLAVREDYQGKGAGKSLYKELLDDCKKEGISTLFLLTTTASDYFKKLGWSEIWEYAVPQEIRQSEEFKSLCHQNTACMRLSLGHKQADKAVATFNSGFNCAQSVFSAFAGDFQLPENLSLKMTTGLGAGIGNKGNVCGAVLAAYMVLGLKHGRERTDDLEAKENTSSKMQQFDKRFLQRYGSVYCRKLLKGDVSNAIEREEIVKRGLFKNACPVFIFTASEIVQDLIEQQ